MANEQPDKKEEVTPQGAVEVDEEDLDQAAGGLSMNYSKIEMTYKPSKPQTAPQDLTGGSEPGTDGPKWKI